MKFLIDGSEARIKLRRSQASELIAGQLLTPLTRYRRAERYFGIDNGGFTGAKIEGFTKIINNQWEARSTCLFAAIPDKVGSHKQTLKMWAEHNHIADGYKKAFVVQDGFDYWPDNAEAIFLGGSTDFKDSLEAEQIVTKALADGMHVHIGRVNTCARFFKFDHLGAHTCDGSGVSMYDHMIEKIAQHIRTKQIVTQINFAF